MPLTQGQLIGGRYRVVSLLRRGGMGAVYRAWDTQLNVSVAIKEMTPQPGLAPHTMTQLHKQFQQEATILARLNHPHLVRVTDFFEAGGNVYLVMNFVAGENLADRIEREGALPEPQVLAWAEQLLDALAYCHSEGIIHRDVKPQNVVITPEEGAPPRAGGTGGGAVLVDFGLIKLWDPRDPRTRAAIRAMCTPEYAPPERYDATDHTDPRSDIYSLGATLYHAITGQAPPTATMRIANPGSFQLPRTLNPRLSLTTEATVVRATELAIDNRFATAQQMAAALSGKAVASKRKSKVLPPTRPLIPLRRPVPGWVRTVSVLAVLALVVIATLVILERRPTPPPAPEGTINSAVPATGGDPVALTDGPEQDWDPDWGW